MGEKQPNPYHLQENLSEALASLHYQFALTATNEADLLQWQHDFRGALSDVLKITNRIPSDVPATTFVASRDRGKFIEELHNLQLDNSIIPMYLLIPKTKPPYKAILALHGHGMGVQQILGNYPDSTIAEKMLAQDENFAQLLAEDGYLVCAIEQQGFGKRVANRVSDNANSCQQLAFQYLMSGQTLVGERVRDAIATINYLLSRDDVDRDTIGCTGHSGGGTTALFLTAVDTRVKVCVISGYFCDYRSSILGVRHCECNYVPDLLTLGNMGEISALIAPRPLRLVNGEQDHIFPIEGVHQPYQQLQQAYRLFNAESNVSLVTHPDDHRYDHDLSRAWFDAQMSS